MLKAADKWGRGDPPRQAVWFLIKQQLHLFARMLNCPFDVFDFTSGWQISSRVFGYAGLFAIALRPLRLEYRKLNVIRPAFLSCATIARRLPDIYVHRRAN